LGFRMGPPKLATSHFAQILHGVCPTNKGERAMPIVWAAHNKHAASYSTSSSVSSRFDADKSGLPDVTRAPQGGLRLETKEEVIARARRRLIGAKARLNLTWDDIFAHGDKDKSNNLDFGELKQAVRSTLHISPTSLSDLELELLLAAIDTDRSGSVNLQEFNQYVSHGRRPEDEDSLFIKRTARVKRNLGLAFRKFSTTDAGVRSLFSHIDESSDGNISFYEFNSFVRDDLGLGHWDLASSELKMFYKRMDKNGDGMDVKELVDFVQGTQKDHATDGAFSFVEAKPNSPRKLPTFKSQLRHQFGADGNCVFMNLGRTKRALVR
ncbi:unnamed protein product, partial [Polarella glacialis]